MDIRLDELDVPQSDKLGLAFPVSDINTYAALADAGFGHARLAVSWQLIEPSDDTWNWAGLDSRIKALTDAGIKPLLTFASDADWATSAGDNDAKNLLPVEMAQWAEFVGAVAARYGHLVDDYQVANEFSSIDNRSGGWASSSDALVTYVNTAYEAVKAADATSTLIMGGVASLVADLALVNLEWAEFEPSQPLSATTTMRYTIDEVRSSEADALLAERLLAPLQLAKYDVAAVHLYGDRSLDDLRVDLIEDLSGRRVVVTESGAPTYDGSVPDGMDYFSSSVLSDLGALAAGAETVYWFQDYVTGSTYYNQYVALRDESGNPKPSLWAKKLLAVYLTDDAQVTNAASGVYHIASPTGGDALVGMGASFAAAGLYGSFGTTDIWVLDDPVTGAMHLLAAGENPADIDFVVADTGWLERFVGAGDPAPDLEPEPEPEPESVYVPVQVGSVGIEFSKKFMTQTKISLTVDGASAGDTVYSGQQKMASAHLDALGLSLSAVATGGAQISFKNGRFGVASSGETKADAQQIDGNELLILELDDMVGADEFPSVSLMAWDADNSETAVFSAYHDGTLVASDEIAFVSGQATFDPGVDFDHLEIGAGTNDAFSLRAIEVDWFAL